MSDRGKGLGNILEGVDLLGFGRHAADRTEAEQERAVTAKVGKPGSEADKRMRAVTAKVGKGDRPAKPR